MTFYKNEYHNIFQKLTKLCQNLDEDKLRSLNVGSEFYDPKIWQIAQHRNNRLVVYKGSDSVVKIPYGVTELFGYPDPDIVFMNGAFMSNQHIKEIIIPNSVIEIGANCFFDCKNLTSITIPDSVKVIYSNAFLGCDNLKTIYNYSSVDLSELNIYGNNFYGIPESCKIINK